MSTLPNIPSNSAPTSPWAARPILIWLMLAVCAASLLAMGCKKKPAQDNYVHVDVYGQMDSRYSPILASRFSIFSHKRATLPSGHKIMVSAIMEANFYDHLSDPAYREKAQMIVLNSEQEAAVDPNLATEFVHARKGCTEQVPCYLLIPNSVSGEQREAAQQLLDFLAPPVAAVPATEPTPPAEKSQ